LIVALLVAVLAAVYVRQLELENDHLGADINAYNDPKSALTVRQVLDRASNLTSIGGRQISAKVLGKAVDAQVVQIDNFLTPTQCEDMMQLVHKVIHGPVEPSRPSQWGLAHNPDALTRRCVNSCAKEPTLGLINTLLEELTTRPKANMEDFQLLHYKRQQRYGLHHDYIFAQSQMLQGPREFTVFVYLNDVEQGGETHFPSLGVKVHPKQGRAIIWPNVDYHSSERLNQRTYHEAMPVLKGDKLGVAQWIHSGDYAAGAVQVQEPQPRQQAQIERGPDVGDLKAKGVGRPSGGYRHQWWRGTMGL